MLTGRVLIFINLFFFFAFVIFKFEILLKDMNFFPITWKEIHVLEMNNGVGEKQQLFPLELDFDFKRKANATAPSPRFPLSGSFHQCFR